MFVSQRHRPFVWCFAIAAVALSCGAGAQTSGRRAGAEAIVRRAIDAVGGAERWRSVHTLMLRGRGFRNHVGDSEWFEGPFITTYFDIDEWHDLVTSRHASRVTQHFEMDTNQFTYRAIATLAGSTTLSVNGSSESPSPAATDSWPQEELTSFTRWTEAAGVVA